MKPQKNDPENPFGALIKDGPAGRRGCLNVVREEGDWSDWSRNLASQFLSKQDTQLAKRQLDLQLMKKQDEFNEIMALSNPEVKKKFLLSFGDDCDAAAVHLKAAALPRQTTNVILPIPSLKENEIYAPNYKNGEELILIRYPHGGVFEIPRLIVNNKSKEGKRFMENAKDAVGIHPKAAAQLSGADFDGDTVITIPTKGFKFKTKTALDGLKDFDPEKEFPAVEGVKPWPKGGHREQTEMGMISNLINDMTLKGAPDTELARAVKHSMVVIDVAKHHYNYKLSEEVNGISELKKKYQPEGGPSTLISRASSEVHLPYKRSDSYTINPKTGEKIFKTYDESYVKKVKNKDGSVKEVVQKRTTTSTRMYEAKDAISELSSGLPMEEVYGSYANSMKALGDKARKEYKSLPTPKVNKEAKTKYKDEVNSLMTKLVKAESHAPYERQAQIIANAKWDALVGDNPELKDDKSYKKKRMSQFLSSARESLGFKDRVTFTPAEVEAINAGAFSSNRLRALLANADDAQLKSAFTPREKKGLSESKLATARTRLKKYTTAEVADSLGVSVDALLSALNEK